MGWVKIYGRERVLCTGCDETDRLVCSFFPRVPHSGPYTWGWQFGGWRWGVFMVSNGRPNTYQRNLFPGEHCPFCRVGTLVDRSSLDLFFSLTRGIRRCAGWITAHFTLSLIKYYFDVFRYLIAPHPVSPSLISEGLVADFPRALLFQTRTRYLCREIRNFLEFGVISAVFHSGVYTSEKRTKHIGPLSSEIIIMIAASGEINFPCRYFFPRPPPQWLADRQPTENPAWTYFVRARVILEVRDSAVREKSGLGGT